VLRFIYRCDGTLRLDHGRSHSSIMINNTGMHCKLFRPRPDLTINQSMHGKCQSIRYNWSWQQSTNLCRPLYCVGWAHEAENPLSTRAVVLNWYWTVCGWSSCSHPLSRVIRTLCGRFRVPYSSALLTIAMVESRSFTMVLLHYWSSIPHRN
jgi:hypothetical protein